MERIVYLLGAGFSAPLGLPVMSDFYFKSQDMYLGDPDKYGHFKEVFDTIRDMSIIKNYYEANLFNIEEILSILEMRDYLESRSLKEVFLKYIRDVVGFYTPTINSFAAGKIPGNWADWLYGPSDLWKPYGMFIGAMLNLSVKVSRFGFSGNYENLVCDVQSNPKTHYSIITLNYDLIPETICDYLRQYALPSENSVTPGFNKENVRLAKLHGSIDSGVIVPPTWSKGINKEIVPIWATAYQLLTRATQIRIIGYSLATADAYVKYLIKSAITKEPHIKKIDVICRDPDGSVKARFDDFIKFVNYRFANGTVEFYLRRHVNAYGGGRMETLSLDKLEMAHNQFMTEPNTL
jgi:hypothetical protein